MVNTSANGRSSPSVKIEISVRALTFDDAEAFIRFPSSSDSTITPFVDCATYLYNPGCPDIAKISFNSINLQELSSYKIINSH